MNAKRLVGIGITMFGMKISASTVTWSSGVIVLPNGLPAGIGDVTGYAWQMTRSDIDNLFHRADSRFYNDIKNGNLADPPHGGWTVRSGTSNWKGEVNIENCYGLVDSYYPNCWAVLVYVCECDGYEFYMRSNAWCEPWCAVESYNMSNLALGGTWTKGDAVPEPTSMTLMMFGMAIIALRRKHVPIA